MTGNLLYFSSYLEHKQHLYKIRWNRRHELKPSSAENGREDYVTFWNCQEPLMILDVVTNIQTSLFQIDQMVPRYQSNQSASCLCFTQ